MVATAFLIAGCGSSKNASTVVNDDALSVLKPKTNSPTPPPPPKVEANETVEEVAEVMEKTAKTMDDTTAKPVEEMANEKIEEVAEKIEGEMASQAAEAKDGKVVEKVKEAAEGMKKMEGTTTESTEKTAAANAIEEKAEDAVATAKKAATELSTLETETLEIDEEKVVEEEIAKESAVEEVANAMPQETINDESQQKEMNLVGTYQWVKRVCCGRMRVVTTPQEGEELFMEMTEDGKILYSGNSQKKADDTAYKMNTNALSFPDRQMLKIEGKVDALVRFKGDTLVIDRGYIDLDKNFWVKIKE